MKKLIALMALLMITTACDSPRSQRSMISSSSNGNGLTSGNGTDFGTGNTIPDTTTTTPSNIPADATHCKFSTDGINGFATTSAHLGSYTLCQSSTDKTVFYAQFKTPPVGANGDVSICFIPHTTSGSNSIYVGNPMCGTFTDPKSVKKITFVKYTQYSSALINNVMFFKDTYYYYPMYGKNVMTLDAYKDCMARLALGVSTYCNSFKSVNQYVLQSF
ncbi:hypothetical protein SHI21_17975 [Bacteriovorax sp. PP10]|uniref:Lipoprotein n=1 Tax=Bacteriovorax antarcticus TaxID=3088717 RepID=A0ABU5VZW5_9BACT|nr:hypothetical protein [Bacteriovorax sp. PP10]MEA9358127.1 hypothetical protein [Bacteriovorax sp. PP10]